MPSMRRCSFSYEIMCSALIDADDTASWLRTSVSSLCHVAPSLRPQIRVEEAAPRRMAAAVHPRAAARDAHPAAAHVVHPTVVLHRAADHDVRPAAVHRLGRVEEDDD